MLIQNQDIQENRTSGVMRKWRFVLSLRIVILMLFLLLTGCQKTTQITPKYNGNFPTSQIRNLWMMCSFSWKQKNPFLSREIVWMACDCYADVIREELTPEEVEGPKQITSIDLKKALIDRCNPKLIPNPT